MQRLYLALFAAGALATAVADSSVCRLKTAAAVRETPGGPVIGRLPAQLQVTLYEQYTLDDGSSWSLVEWQGRPKTRNPSYGNNTGWVKPDIVVRCRRS